MEGNWKQTYARLQEYVARNPGISIGTNFVSIPGDVRPGFYQLFDALRTGFVQEYFEDSLVQANALSRAWVEAANAVIGQMCLESIDMAASVRWFLQDPLDGLMRSMFNPLFELLQGTKDETIFEKQGKQTVADDFATYFREGYRQWASLALVSRLNPETNYQVPAVDALADTLMGEGHENPGFHVADVPRAEQSNRISFQQNPVVSFIVPKVVVRSGRLGSFVALHSNFVEPYWSTVELSRNVEWFNFTDLKRDNGLLKIRPDQKILPDMARITPDIAIYTSGEIGDVTLLADHNYILRPHLSIEVMEEPDWYEKGKLSVVKKHHSVMKPIFGTFIICREPPPQAALDELTPPPAAVARMPDDMSLSATGDQAEKELAPVVDTIEDIHIIEAGFDSSRFEKVVDGLIKLKT